MLKHKFCLALAALLACGALAAKPKKPKEGKPVVCADYTVLRGEGRVVAFCGDQTKPVTLVRFVVVEIPSPENDTDTQRVAIGWTKVEQ